MPRARVQRTAAFVLAYRSTLASVADPPWGFDSEAPNDAKSGRLNEMTRSGTVSRLGGLLGGALRASAHSTFDRSANTSVRSRSPTSRRHTP